MKKNRGFFLVLFLLIGLLVAWYAFQAWQKTQLISLLEEESSLSESQDPSQGIPSAFRPSQEPSASPSEVWEDPLSLEGIPNEEEVLARWSEEWKKEPPLYLNETVLSLYIYNPSTGEMWQVAHLPDALTLLELVEEKEVVRAPTADMDLGFLLVTPEHRYHVYPVEAKDSPLGKELREQVEQIKPRTLLSVDLYQLLTNDVVEHLSFQGYLKEDGQLFQLTLETDDEEAITEFMHLLQKIRIQSLQIDEHQEDLQLITPPQDGNYSFTLSLGPPYESGETLTVLGFPYAFLTQLTRQQGQFRTYGLSISESMLLLQGVAEMEAVEKIPIKEEPVERVLYVDLLSRHKGA